MMMLMKEREILTRGPGRGMPRRARVRDLVSGARAWLARSAALAALLLAMPSAAQAQGTEQSETIDTTCDPPTHDGLTVEGQNFTIRTNNVADIDGMWAYESQGGITVSAKGKEWITKVVITCGCNADKVTDESITVSPGTKTVSHDGETATVTVENVNASKFVLKCSENVIPPFFNKFVVYYLPEKPTFSVSLKKGTDDAAKWTAKAGEGEAKALPLEGVAEGATVTLQYEGRKRVMSVRATKKVPWDGDLSKLTGKEPEGFATATNGMTITGTLADGVNVKVTIADRATVTLKDATISGVNSSACEWAGLTCEGNATIVLRGTNSVKGFHEDYPGIYVTENNTLTISGDGSLTASPFDGGTGYSYGAGIGGGLGIPCGNITIEGGSITATGGKDAAGIGGGGFALCGDIRITGGKVEAKGGENAAGIGSGFGDGAWCGDIRITGGTVEAEGGDAAAGIGGGYYATCGDIRITGGTVEAKGGEDAAGIGGGYKASCGDITITSGVTKVTATKGSGYAQYSIGKGFSSDSKCGTVTIGCTLGTDGNPVDGTGKEGMVETSPFIYTSLSKLTADYTAKNGETLTGTLQGNVKISIAEDATVTLSEAKIEGTHVNQDAYKHAGITCLGDATIVLVGTNKVTGFYDEYPGIHVPENKTLTISGDGSLTASPFDGGGTDDSYGAGIGGGYEIACGNITIEGGSITATGGYDAAGIGGGYKASCGDIRITGGTITTTGGHAAAGIGSGYAENASCGDIRITGGTVEAKGGIAAAGIGGGYDATCLDITITSGVTKVTATKGSIGAPCSIGKGDGSNASCGTVTIGCTIGTDGNPVAGTGTVYWDGSKFVNGGDAYLSQSPLTYPEPPKLGDLYYSDGTWSSTLVAGKTPIGVIAYLGTDEFTETGTTVGGSTFTGHGLVLCLKNAASGVIWSTELGTDEFGESASVDDVDDLKRTTDVSGYTNTATLAAMADAATKYPAAYQAKNYTGLAAPATGTTGWFLPSAQQWVKMMEGLGGLAESDITWDNWFNTNHSAATSWETAMAKAGATGTAYDSVTDDYLWYWSSSEYSAYGAVLLGIDATGTGSGYGFFLGVFNKSSSDYDFRVRPVLAF